MDSWEYTFIGGMAAFLGLIIVILGLLGLGQAQASELPGSEDWNVLDGIGFLLTNPFSEPYTSLLYTALIVGPISIISVLLVTNIVRGR